MNISSSNLTYMKWGIMGIICMAFLACDSLTQPRQNSLGSDSTSTQDITGDLSVNRDNHQPSRGIARSSANFAFEDRFPLLYSLIKDQPDILDEVTIYAEKAVYRTDINDEETLLALLEARDENIIPLITPYIENLDQADWVAYQEDLSSELNQLGIQMTSVEGEFTGLGPKKMLTNNLRVNQPEALLEYDAFTDAQTTSRSGEYPFLNMQPYFEMLSHGEELMKSDNARSYYSKVSDEFQKALHVLTDIHIVTNEGGRVGGIHTEAYPYACDIEQMKSLADQYQQSQYHEVITRILNDPSEITARPANIYLVVNQWADSEEAAQEKILTHFNQNRDIPHYLPVYRGNNIPAYAVIYRFYENEEKANAALVQLDSQNIEAELIFVSVKDDKLYQIGV